MEHNFEIFADYFQFNLQDDDIDYGDLGECWTKEAVEKGLALAPHTIGVGTARNMPVPVTVRICNERPKLDAADFDRINECSIELGTGRLVVMGCTDYWYDAARIAVRPGVYDALIGYRNLDSLSEDGLDGDDSYHVFLWPRSPQAPA